MSSRKGKTAVVEHAVEAEAAPAVAAPAARRRPSAVVIVLALLPILFAAEMFALRIGRPLEQGGDAYSDSNAILAGENFEAHGFAALHFLPVVVPAPTLPPASDEYYTHYPPGADLMNGFLRKLGLHDLRAWRWVSAIFSLAGLAFWFFALRRLFGDAVAVTGVAAYALNFSFIWLGDAIHHYGYSDFLRSLAFWLGVKHAENDVRPLDTALLALALFAQSLLAFDYLPATHVLLLALGATGFRGVRLRRLLLFAAMPVIGVGLHLLQNAWALGASESLADMRGAFLQRALASGAGDYRHFSPASLLRSVLWDTQQLMGIGLGAILAFAAFGVGAWIATAPEEERERGPRVVGAIALAASVWFVLMHQHAGEHPYSNRQLLPLASIAIALGLVGIWRLASRGSSRAAFAITAIAAAAVLAEGYLGYVNDDNRRLLTTRSFAVAYARKGDIPPGVTVASNIPAPAPPALQVVLNRRAKKVRNLAELEAEFGRGATVIYLFSPAAPIDPPLLDLLHRGRVIKMDQHGVAVEITVPSGEPAEGGEPAAPVLPGAPASP